MRHGDGKEKTLGDEESYTIGSCENESFIKKNFSRSLCEEKKKKK